MMVDGFFVGVSGNDLYRLFNLFIFHTVISANHNVMNKGIVIAVSVCHHY